MNIAVIIPTKTATNLEACAWAVLDNDGACKLIVVDDGLEYFPSSCVEASVFKGIAPFCFARNVNIGIRSALGYSMTGRPFPGAPDLDGVVILNDDAILKTPGGFTLLAQAAKEHPEYGLIAATTNVVGNLNQRPLGIGLREEPRMACFVCVYIPRQTVETVGLLDERFGIGGFEDDDYCLRVRRAGLKIGIHDEVFVDHGSLVSTIRGPGGPGYNPRGADIFREKWGAGNHEV